MPGDDEGFCPISHIQLRELQMAVIFRGDRRVVYDAEHLVLWLQQCRSRNPMTNAAVPVGSKLANLLEPFQLPHMNEAHLTATVRFLIAQGSIGILSQKERRECVGVYVYTLVLLSAVCGTIFVCECVLDQFDTEPLAPLAGSCFWVPSLLIPAQITGLTIVLWAFPQARYNVTLAILLTAVMFLLANGLVMAFGPHLTPEDLRRHSIRVLELCLADNHTLLHPRLARITERLLQKLMLAGVTRP